MNSYIIYWFLLENVLQVCSFLRTGTPVRTGRAPTPVIPFIDRAKQSIGTSPVCRSVLVYETQCSQTRHAVWKYFGTKHKGIIIRTSVRIFISHPIQSGWCFLNSARLRAVFNCTSKTIDHIKMLTPPPPIGWTDTKFPKFSIQWFCVVKYCKINLFKMSHAC